MVDTKAIAKKVFGGCFEKEESDEDCVTFFLHKDCNIFDIMDIEKLRDRGLEVDSVGVERGKLYILCFF